MSALHRAPICFDIHIFRSYSPLKRSAIQQKKTVRDQLAQGSLFIELGRENISVMKPDEQDEMNEWHEALLRVRYAETDKMGVVYHANYLVWFEIGRTEFCRARGFSYRDLEEDENAFLVVAESYCRYKAPAYYDDELIVRTHITELRRRSLRFGYEIVRVSDGVVIAEGETGHVVTDATGRVRTLPQGFAELLLSPPVELENQGEPVPETSPA